MNKECNISNLNIKVTNEQSNGTRKISPEIKSELAHDDVKKNKYIGIWLQALS